MVHKDTLLYNDSCAPILQLLSKATMNCPFRMGHAKAAYLTWNNARPYTDRDALYNPATGNGPS